MFIKKALALVLAAATAFTVLPAAVLADETTAEQSETAQKKEVLLYSENFENNPVIHLFGNNNSGAFTVYTDVSKMDQGLFKVAQDEGNTENATNYGCFFTKNTSTEMKTYERVGYQFYDDGIKTGNVRVKFKFRLKTDGAKSGMFFLGSNASRWNWLSCVGVNNSGTIGLLNRYTDATKLLDGYTAGTWYSYDATLNLDNESIDARLYDMGGNQVGSKKWTANGTQRPASSATKDRNNPFFDWPNNWEPGDIASGSPFSIKSFSAYVNMDLDDIEVYCDPIEATGFMLVRDGDGYKGKLTFNYSAVEVGNDAVKIGNDIVTGERSADGKTYTFDIPANLVGGNEYTVTVDQSKIKMNAVQTSVVDKGDNLYGEGTKEFPFTIKKEVLLYSEDFENDPEIHYFGNNNSGAVTVYKDVSQIDQGLFKVAQDSTNTENATKYGCFFTKNTSTEMKTYERVGYQFYDDGIKTGNVRVKFKFRLKADGATSGMFLLGSNATVWNWLSCVGSNSSGTVGILNRYTGATKLLDGYKAGNWYSYEATLNLDNESIDASLYDMDGNVLKNLTWAANGVKRTVVNSNQPFYDWPNNWQTAAQTNSGSPFSVKSFSAYVNMDLDDIKIYCDPIEVTDFKLVRNDGKEYSDDVSFLTARRGQITFNYRAEEVEDGAVKIGEETLKDGTLSADGMTYTFDIPIDFVGNKEYTITVDQTKIKMKAVQEAVNDGTNLYGEGTKEFRFTPRGVINFSEDFDKGDVDFFDIDNDGVSTKVTDTAKYAQKADTEGGNKYGHFCDTVIYTAATNDTDTDETSDKIYYGVDWDRRALDFDKNGVTDGKLKIHFRFRPTAQTFETKQNVKKNVKGEKGNVGSFGSVLIGNSDQLGANGVGHAGTNNAKGNWLPLINVKNGKLQTLSVDGSAASMPLKDSSNIDATVKQDTWYTCDAVLDLDAHALDIKVVEDETNTVFRASHSGLTTRTSEWGVSTSYPAVWPTATQPCFKSFGVLAAMDIDDIKISTDYSPSLTATQTTATAKATTVKENNYMIIAQYDKNDRIVSVEEKKFTLEEGKAAVYSKDVNWADGAERAKAFIWDNLNDANPLEKCAEITKPAAQ